MKAKVKKKLNYSKNYYELFVFFFRKIIQSDLWFFTYAIFCATTWFSSNHTDFNLD